MAPMWREPSGLVQRSQVVAGWVLAGPTGSTRDAAPAPQRAAPTPSRAIAAGWRTLSARFRLVASVFRLASRLSRQNAKDLTRAVADRTSSGNELVEKVQRLAALTPDKESDVFSLEEIQTLAAVFAAGYDFLQADPEGYEGLRREVERILTTGE
jgi:hypothetical protein